MKKKNKEKIKNKREKRKKKREKDGKRIYCGIKMIENEKQKDEKGVFV